MYTHLTNEQLDSELTKAIENDPHCEYQETSFLFQERSRRIRDAQNLMARNERQYLKTGYWPHERGKGYRMLENGWLQISLSSNQVYIVVDQLEAMEAKSDDFIEGRSFVATSIDNWYGIESHIYPEEIGWISETRCDSEDENRIEFAKQQGLRAAHALENKINRVLELVNPS